ncbi:MAG: NADH-quinone oxidoreductase subunit L [Deltaproteobacteria bacterium]
MVETNYLAWIPALPLAASVVHVVAGRRLGRSGVGVLASLAVAAAFALSLRAFMALVAGAPETILTDHLYTWINTGGFTAEVGFVVDRLSAVMCLVVTGVGSLIHVYSIGYMDKDEDYARYFAYLNFFTSAMLILVLADNLVLMFVGWEGVGLASYLLIGFWYQDPAKAAAGRKAFIVNRVGDAAFVLGAFVLYWALSDLGHGSLAFADINAAARLLPPGLVLVACLLLFVGATGKSAQIPLFVWLPDAMAGPTPVSALIHAATMVTAGVYMVARLSDLFVAAPLALTVVATVGAITALGAALVAVVQNDIKKVLAYSTISQLGYMFLALGVGAFSAAVFHLVTHAFFKALLFLGAGSVIHALGGQQDIGRMGGLREKMPVTAGTFFVATLAIAGIPGLAGFFSKDEILARTAAGGHWMLWTLAVFTALVTAFYMARLFVLVFGGSYRGDAKVWDHVHESPVSMTGVLVVLALASAAGGLLGVPAILGGNNALARWLAPVVAGSHGHLSHGLEWGLMAVSSVVAVAGVALAWWLYRRGPDADRVLVSKRKALHETLVRAYYVDEVYDREVARRTVSLGGDLWRIVDEGLIDRCVNAIGAAVVTLSGLGRRWTTGNFQHYALALLLGAAVLTAAVVGGVGR